MKKIILNKFFKRFVCFFLIFSILFLSCFRLYAKPQKAEAFAPALIGLGVAVAFGLVTLGIAVTNTDVSNPGADKTNALAYACDFWEQKKQEAIAKGLVTAFEVNQWLYNAGAGLYDTTSACYDWIKESAHNIYNNASYFQGSASSIQFGNVYDRSIAFCSGDFCISTYSDGFYLFPFSESVYKNRDDVFVLKDVICFSAYDSSTTSLANETVAIICSSPPLNYDFKKGSLVARNCSKYIFNGITYYVSYAHLNLPCNRFYYNYPASTDDYKSFADYYSNLFASKYDGTYFYGVDNAGVQMYFNYLSRSSGFNTGISAQLNQSAKNLYTGADTNESAAERILKGDTYVSYNIGTSSASAGAGAGTGSGSGSLGGDVVSPGDSSSTGSVGLGNDVIGSKSGVISCPTTPDDISITLKKLIEGEKSLADVLADAQATPYVVGKIDSKTGVLNPTADPSIAANPSIADGVTTATLDVSTGELIEEKDETTGKPKYKPFIPSNNPGSGIGFSKLLANFLYKTFPFCLPFDIYSVLCVFTGGSSDGYNTFSSGGLVRAPVITLDLSFFENFFKYYGYSGSSKSLTSSELVSSDSYDITIDFSPFDRAAALFRALWEVLFVILLSKNAKKLIHGGDG